MRVEDFKEIPPRARTALINECMFSMSDVAWRSDEDLLAIDGVGESSVAKIRAWAKAEEKKIRRSCLKTEAMSELGDAEKLGRRLLVEWVRNGVPPSYGMAHGALNVAMEFYRHLDAEAEKLAERWFSEEHPEEYPDG